MGDADQLRRALADGFAVQVSHAILGHHESDVIAAGHHTRALFQHPGDSADERTVFQRGCAR